MTLLVVEDDGDLRDVIAEELSANGYAVRVAGDGSAALEILKTQAIDLILTDIRMPLVDGIELCRRVREQGATFPIIFMTGYAAELSLDLARRHGATALLLKPFTLDQLVATIRAGYEVGSKR